jgi:cytochrome bd-type quinol oxidase subunit 2
MIGPADKEVKRDRLGSKERIGELVSIVGCFIVLLFFVIHDTRPTGFFTEEFGTVAAVLLYSMLAIGFLPIVTRLITGRRNHPARLFESAVMAVFFIGQLYFLAVFPFDMSHFADPFPDSLEFLIDWISPTIAKILLAIGVVGGAVFTVYNYILYLAVKERLTNIDAVPEDHSRCC